MAVEDKAIGPANELGVDHEAVEPWTRTAQESVRSFQAFLVYLHMGQDRSIDKAYWAFSDKSIPPPGCRTCPSSWRVKAVKYKWYQRAREYDRRQYLVERDRLEMARTKGYQVLREHVESAVTKWVDVAHGKEKCNSVQWMALCRVLDTCGIGPPKEDLQTGVAVQSNVHIYLPDNGRGPTR